MTLAVWTKDFLWLTLIIETLYITNINGIAQYSQALYISNRYRMVGYALGVADFIIRNARAYHATSDICSNKRLNTYNVYFIAAMSHRQRLKAKSLGNFCALQESMVIYRYSICDGDGTERQNRRTVFFWTHLVILVRQPWLATWWLA
jgi:hypothetical protein